MLYLGCDLPTWYSALRKNRFSITPSRLPHVLGASLTAAFTSLLGYAQKIRFARQLTEIRITQPPIFIVGHWRSGSTLLHEMLCLDQRLAFANNYACFAPHHFLLTESWFAQGFNLLAPAQRPMDAMTISWELPQEDEIALCGLGADSPYWSFIFPHSSPFELEPADQWSEKEREHWKSVYLWFLQVLTLKHQRRLILKSPAHIYRVPLLHQLFPDARYVQIVRRPFETIFSTLRMHESLRQFSGLQKGNCPLGLAAATQQFVQYYDCAQQAKNLVADNFYVLRYEDLIENPLSILKTLYGWLNLGSCDEVLPRWERYLQLRASFPRHRYTIDDTQWEHIAQNCRSVLAEYNYSSTR